MTEEQLKVNEVIDLIDEVVELFYQQKIKEGLEKFDNVLVKIAELIDILDKYKKEHIEFKFDEEKIQNILIEAMNALEEKDIVLMADILQYDFKEYLNELFD